ncbi:MAG: hypothetical protein O2795_05040 [Acidobacteria bacterium]|nr:hypothetical protein [Acidobacteriota bacterium]
MRSIFDQYTQPENRLTHSLASVLHQDRALLQSFLASFGPKTHPPVRKLKVIEQGLPGRPELSEAETFAKGLPDALIFTDTDEGWALIIESTVGDALTKDQLRRHVRTIEKYGFDAISGLAITVREPGFDVEGWRMITWKDVYSWGQQHRKGSPWAAFLVEYFNVAETRMANDEYLKEGTITEFSGISFDPYTYLEGKRVLRLLTGKLRDNKKFVKEMGLDAASGRPSITDQGGLWDIISFLPADGKELAFQRFPHCTVSIGPVVAKAMITFPHGMRTSMRKRLHGSSFEDFAARLKAASDALSVSLKGLNAYRPMIRVQQRRYKTQRSVPMMDGIVEFDLRATLGDSKPHFGPPIKKQDQWAQAAYELLANKHSNIQFQVGAQFYYPQFDELAHKDADQHFISAFQALRPFVGAVIDF